MYLLYKLYNAVYSFRDRVGVGRLAKFKGQNYIIMGRNYYVHSQKAEDEISLRKYERERNALSRILCPVL